MTNADQLARLRRLIAEPTPATYSDSTLLAMLDARNGDLHATAADVWEEKAAQLASGYDFSADGASHSRSQQYAQATRQVAYHRARRQPGTITARLVPRPEGRDVDP